PELDCWFRSSSLANRVQLDLRIPVPVAGVQIDVPYAYQNGTYNLVKPERFTRMDRALQLACEGSLLQRHPVNGRQHRLIVVPFTDESEHGAELRHRIEGVFENESVRVV